MSNSKQHRVGIIILAAGASTRMGKPKQLLLYQGRSFLQHTIETALNSQCRPILVILGANAAKINPKISNFTVQIVENQQWSEGMSASIRVGMEALIAVQKNITAVVITLCDQPFLSAAIIKKIFDVYLATDKPIVACQYADTLGVPALFSRAIFSELMNLQAGMGAKYIINKYHHDVLSVPFPEGAIDIDTPQDYEQLKLMIHDSDFPIREV
ncbi:MAG: nucleotidyltransferase family protein [Nostocaceae cyanobacterium]|nr:nucleotidyltransferase family protein [Nostocaceae cyanobacterium]